MPAKWAIETIILQIFSSMFPNYTQELGTLVAGAFKIFAYKRDLI